jgi:hypothetical protein
MSGPDRAFRPVGKQRRDVGERAVGLPGRRGRAGQLPGRPGSPRERHRHAQLGQVHRQPVGAPLGVVWSKSSPLDATQAAEGARWQGGRSK